MGIPVYKNCHFYSTIAYNLKGTVKIAASWLIFTGLIHFINTLKSCVLKQKSNKQTKMLNSNLLLRLCLTYLCIPAVLSGYLILTHSFYKVFMEPGRLG